MSNAARRPRRKQFILSKKGNKRPPADNGAVVRKGAIVLGVEYPGPPGWWFQIKMLPVHGIVVPVKVYRAETMAEYEARIAEMKASKVNAPKAQKESER